jgi:hypothetical protein
MGKFEIRMTNQIRMTEIYSSMAAKGKPFDHLILSFRLRGALIRHQNSEFVILALAVVPTPVRDYVLGSQGTTDAAGKMVGFDLCAPSGG